MRITRWARTRLPNTLPARVALGGAMLSLFSITAVMLMPLVYGWLKARTLEAPADTRFSADNARVAASGRRPSLVIIGDSRAAHWPVPLRQKGDAMVIRGIPGETSVQTILRLPHDAFSMRPVCVLVVTGINDLVAASYMDATSRRLAVQDVVDRLRSMAAMARQAGVGMAVSTIPPPSEPDWARRLVWRDSLRTMVVLVNDALRTTPGIRIFDAAGMLDPSNSGMLAVMSRADTLHLNRAAYAHLQEHLSGQLDQCAA